MLSDVPFAADEASSTSGAEEAAGGQSTRPALFVRMRTGGRFWFNTGLKASRSLQRQYLLGRLAAGAVLCEPRHAARSAAGRAV